jgi:formylglycine-generating enzyme required for sulfatase activity
MVTLLESCFDEQDHRPSDASALADKLRLIVDQTKVNPEPGETFAPIRTAPALPTPTTVVKTDAPRTISQEPSSDDLTTSDHQQPILDSQIITSIGLKMNLLPAGDFMMGSRRDDTEAHSGEKPPKNVRIDHEFYLGVTPVTNAHYSRMMPQAPPHDHNERDRPVVNVTWFDAIDFCNALSRAEGVPPYYESHDGHITIPDLAAIGYRLPTEAEWEYACRAGTTTRFSFGDRPQTRTFDRFAWYIENSDKYLHNVGQKESNRFGLFDMHGNVWEWCWDAPGSQLSKKSTLNATRATAEKPFSAGTGTIISPLLSKEHATRELTIYSHMNPDAQKKILSKAKKDPGYAASLLKEIDSFKKRSSGGRLKAFKNLKTLILSIHGSPPNSIQSENARPLLTSHSREHLKDQKKGSDRIVGPKVLSDEPTKRGRGAPRLSELRVFRGGAFDSFRAALRSANKSYSWPKHHDLDLGFRIARNAPSNPAL